MITLTAAERLAITASLELKQRALAEAQRHDGNMQTVARAAVERAGESFDTMTWRLSDDGRELIGTENEVPDDNGKK